MNARWDDLVPGEGPAPMELGPITLKEVVRYQGASGDFNPIHHDPDVAARAGFDAPLVIGMYHVGVMNGWATDWLGAENVRRTRARWRDQVWPGDVLDIGGKVLDKYEAEGERWVDIEISAERRGGSVVAQTWMTFVVPD